MLTPVTKKITNESDGEEFRFAFYCDICGKRWDSVPYHSDGHIHDAPEREGLCAAAYERANLEALSHFNRCPECKRMVCDDCFRILEERDLCKECAKSI